MALSRRFKMGERWSLDVRSDFFNVMNRANCNNPGASLFLSAAQFPTMSARWNLKMASPAGGPLRSPP